ncbi:hypothetical protein AXX17_AT5G10950 [Arabidopsis thaliana]|uniref:Uncharacterized protein n=1 Tax=Arabidopsis thaliana TaxID=3702 RepID=A0A178UJY7_ARATH|nr:hypothetical protein AXX17_AT5G10950 [Arabidopsis thaliana]
MPLIILCGNRTKRVGSIFYSQSLSSSRDEQSSSAGKMSVETFSVTFRWSFKENESLHSMIMRLKEESHQYIQANRESNISLSSILRTGSEAKA